MTRLQESRMMLVDVLRCDGHVYVDGSDYGRCGESTTSFAVGPNGDVILQAGWLGLTEVGGTQPVLHFCRWDHMYEHVVREWGTRHPAQAVETVEAITTDEVFALGLSTSMPAVTGV